MADRSQLRAPKPATPPVLDARELLGVHRELRLKFRGEVYTLRVTRNDRLILTK